MLVRDSGAIKVDKAEFAQRLRMLRLCARMGNDEFAARLGLAPRTVKYWQYADSDVLPETRNLQKICDLFGINEDYLLGKTSEMPRIKAIGTSKTILVNVSDLDRLMAVAR